MISADSLSQNRLCRLVMEVGKFMSELCYGLDIIVNFCNCNLSANATAAAGGNPAGPMLDVFVDSIVPVCMDVEVSFDIRLIQSAF